MQQTSRSLNLPWDDVRLFLALCRARTLGDAARTLGVDGSTVSRRLASLEETLGASLFDRGRHGVLPTPAAEALLPVAEEIEQAMARFSGAAESLERDVAGLVRIACPPDAAEVMVVPHLPTLLRKHPHLQIQIDAGEALVDVGRRAADIALRVVRPDRGDLIMRSLQPVTWVLAASPAQAATLGEVTSWDAVPWVTFGDRFAHLPAARWVASHAQRAPIVRSDSLRLQIEVVRQGVGAALLPVGSVAHYGLTEVPLSPRLRASMTPWPSDPLVLLTHRALRRVPRVAAVWEFLLERAAAL